MATKKVIRVAVAIDRDGNWMAAGWTDADDDDKKDAAREHVADGERIYWLTAELEIPERESEDAIIADVTLDDINSTSAEYKK